MMRLLTILSLTILLGCKEKDDEKLILALINDAAQLAMDHETGKLMDLTTDTFTADPGSRDAESVRSVLTYAFMRYGKFTIIYPQPRVEVAPNRETATAKVPFVIVREGGPIPDLLDLVGDPEKWLEEAGKGADPYHLDIWFWKEGGEWKVDRARIQGIRSMEGI